MNTSECDWHFFESEWESFKMATTIVFPALMEELYSCMAFNLKRLVYDQGGKKDLTYRLGKNHFYVNSEVLGILIWRKKRVTYDKF